MSTTKKTLYAALADLMQRQRNLANRFLDAAPLLDADHHLNMKADIEDEIERLVKEHLPSGSGFDAGTTLDLDMSDSSVYRYPGRLAFKTSFHHMDEHGGYDGWTDHFVHAMPDWQGITLVVTGRDRKQIKEYIHETFHQALMQEVEVTDIPPKPEGWKPEPTRVQLLAKSMNDLAEGIESKKAVMRNPDAGGYVNAEGVLDAVATELRELIRAAEAI